MNSHEARPIVPFVAWSLVWSVVCGTLAGAIIDGNGLMSDDAYLLGLWVGFAAIWFVLAGSIWWTVKSLTIAAAAWWLGWQFF